MKRLISLIACLALAAPVSLPASAAQINIVFGSIGGIVDFTRKEIDRFEAQTGHTVQIVQMPHHATDQFAQYKTWLSAQTEDVDVYQVDVIWAPQVARHFVDLKSAMGDEINEFHPPVAQSQTVNGRLIAVPLYTGTGMLYYRKDLLEKYGKKIPETWDELTETATEIMNAERAAGNGKMWGFVFQADSWEGLTCNALEWIKSHGGGSIVEPDGTISINNPRAARALELARSWIGTISPEGVLGYQEEESRGVWQLGNAVFMRNWDYAYVLGESPDSPVRGKFGVTVLPHGGGKSAGTVGGWNLAVSKYSKNREAAIELVKFLSSHEVQKRRALALSLVPTRPALYDDPDLADIAPFIQGMRTAAPRPSAPTKRKYNEVSQAFWDAAHKTLRGEGSPSDNLAALESKIKRIRGSEW